MTRGLWVPAFAFAALAQQSAPLAFEAASLKPSNGTLSDVRMGCRLVDPSMYECLPSTLRVMLEVAYGVKADQIKGPPWIAVERYSLTAKVREGVAVSQVLVMLRALLAERFKIALHKVVESRRGYELTVAKGGPKMKEVDPAEVAAANAAPPPALGVSAPGTIAARRGSMPPIGNSTISLSPSGTVSQQAKMPIPQLANLLSTVLGMPVVDKTDLKGTYEVVLTYVPDQSESMYAQLAQMRADAAETAGAAPVPEANAGPTLFQAVEKLGLKLEAKNLPVEVLVIDQANKVPIEN